MYLYFRYSYMQSGTGLDSLGINYDEVFEVYYKLR